MTELTTENDGNEDIPAGTVLEKTYDASFAVWRRKAFRPAIYSDDFEATLVKWANSAALGSSAITRDTTQAVSGTASMKCVTRTSSQAANDFVRALRKSAMPGSKKVRFTVAFWLDNLSKNQYMIFTFTYYDGATKHLAVIQYDVVNTKWQYLDATDGSTFVDISGATNKLAASVFHNFEIDIDFSTNKYLRFRCNGLAKTMGNAFYTVADASTKESFDQMLETTTQGSSEATAYFDDAILEEVGE